MGAAFQPRRSGLKAVPTNCTANSGVDLCLMIKARPKGAKFTCETIVLVVSYCRRKLIIVLPLTLVSHSTKAGMSIVL